MSKPQFKIGDKLRQKQLKTVATLVDVTKSSGLLEFADGTNAHFPWEWIIRDFEKVR